MVHRATALGADWRLVYTGRSRASMPFLGELPDDDRVWIRPDTEYGIPASGAELLEDVPDGASVYCCGPVPMITGVRVDLALTGAKAVHFERFAPPPIVDGEPFQLTLRRSGQVLDVPGDRTRPSTSCSRSDPARRIRAARVSAGPARCRRPAAGRCGSASTAAPPCSTYDASGTQAPMTGLNSRIVRSATTPSRKYGSWSIVSLRCASSSAW